MSTSAVSAGELLPAVVTELNIYVQWAEQGSDASRVAEQAEEICRLYRAMAICLLVIDADVDAFFHWLLHSPITRLFHLRKARAAGLGPSRHLRASFSDPMLDAMAARQWQLAMDIGDLTAADWMEGEEYEDDYCYGEFLRRMARPEEHDNDALLARWREALEGGDDPRLSIAEALVAGRAADFEDALKWLLTDSEARASAMAAPKTRSTLASELPFYPNRWVSIEALALLAIAERRGIIIADELQGCPRMVRAGTYSPFRVMGYPNQGLA